MWHLLLVSKLQDNSHEAAGQLNFEAAGQLSTGRVVDQELEIVNEHVNIFTILQFTTQCSQCTLVKCILTQKS